MKIADITAKISSMAGNKQTFIIILVSLIFIIIALYTYRRFVSERINRDYVANSEFNNTGDKKSADMYFFTLHGARIVKPLNRFGPILKMKWRIRK